MSSPGAAASWTSMTSRSSGPTPLRAYRGASRVGDRPAVPAHLETRAGAKDSLEYTHVGRCAEALKPVA